MADPAPEIVSAEQVETAGLVSLLHRLHALSMWLVAEQPGPDETVREVLELLDAAAPLAPALARIAPAVLGILSALDEVRDTGELVAEFAEVHRLLGHGLRDLGVEPGPPDVPVADLLRPMLGGERPGPPLGGPGRRCGPS